MIVKSEEHRQTLIVALRHYLLELAQASKDPFPAVKILIEVKEELVNADLMD